MSLIRPAVGFCRSLTARLIFVTTSIVAMSSASLSLVFAHVEIVRAYRALLENGALIAQGLAESSRYSVLAGDVERIQQLAQAVLTGETVVYVVVVGREGDVLAEAHTPIADRWFPEGMVQGLPSIQTNGSEPLSSTFDGSELVVHLLRKDSRVLEPHSHPVDSWSAMWSLLVSPDDRSLYDVVVPIRPVRRFDVVEGMLGTNFSMPANAKAPPLYGAVAIGFSGTSVHRAVRDLIGRILLTTLLVIAIAIALTVVTARRITAPLGRLRHAALEIADGNWNIAIPMGGDNEVGDLKRALHTMVASLKSRDRELHKLTAHLEETVEDRTRELQAANEKLRVIDQLKTELISSASHELRTPLTSIKMHVDNLFDGVGGGLSNDQLDALHRIRSNIERLRRLLDELLDLSRLEAGGQQLNYKSLDLGALLHEVLTQSEHLVAQKHLVLCNKVPLDTFLIKGDYDALLRVFGNIVDNAVKFSPIEGAIRIEAVRSTPDLVMVAIADQGCGISPEDLPKVFLPFFRSSSIDAKFRGAGLGLSIAARLVQAHQGTIEVHSAVGCGSEFRVTLPVLPA